MTNILDKYNTKYIEHAIKVFLASDKLIKERDASTTEDASNRYFTYNLNQPEEYAVFSGQYGVLQLFVSYEIEFPIKSLFCI